MTGMKKTAIIFTCTVLAFSLSISNGAYGEEAKEPAVPEAQLIDANAALNENHPAIEEGVTCNDCHELKLDARTTATEAWLTGDYLKWKAGEGIMPKGKVWDRVVEIFRQKGFKRTMVLATSMNNKPATTTAEFALDTKRHVLYGLHEKSTAKLMHIKNNPYVSLNWHREFDDNFANTLCIQAVGRAEILDASAKEFEEGLSVYPYQYGAAARKLTVEGWKAIIKKEMAMTKITIEQIVLVDGGLAGTEFRTSQRWMRK